MKPYRDKEKTKNSRLSNNYNNKNLRTLVDDSHQKVACRETAKYIWNSGNLDPLIVAR